MAHTAVRLFSLFVLLGFLAASNASRAAVRVAHASPDAPSVDVVVNDNFASPAFTNAPFTGVTPYAALPSATYNFKVVPTGATEPVVIDADVPIDETKDYTIAASNFLASITPLVFEDDNSLVEDMARVRFIHLSPDAPTVDVQLAGGGAVLFDDVSFTQTGGYISVPGGSYNLDVVLSSDPSMVALSVPGVELANNTVYTVYAMGSALDPALPSLQAVVSVDAVPEPTSAGLLLAGALVLGLQRRRQ